MLNGPSRSAWPCRACPAFTTASARPRPVAPPAPHAGRPTAAPASCDPPPAAEQRLRAVPVPSCCRRPSLRSVTVVSPSAARLSSPASSPLPTTARIPPARWRRHVRRRASRPSVARSRDGEVAGAPVVEHAFADSSRGGGLPCVAGAGERLEKGGVLLALGGGEGSGSHRQLTAGNILRCKPEQHARSAAARETAQGRPAGRR